VLRNAQHVIAIELMVAAQAVDWRVGMQIDPTSPRHEMSVRDLKTAGVAQGIAPMLRPVYEAIRKASPTVTRDRMLSDDVRRIFEAFFSAGTRTIL
jgi:histidine ammonia-lyase